MYFFLTFTANSITGFFCQFVFDYLNYFILKIKSNTYFRSARARLIFFLKEGALDVDDRLTYVVLLTTKYLETKLAF